MNNKKEIQSVNNHETFLPNRNNFDGLKERFGELYVLYALRNDLNTVIEGATQNN